MSNHLVFVYGTLKRDQPNHYFMAKLDSVRYVGPATTMQAFPLVIGSQWNLPMLLDKPGHGKVVKGEVYEVNDTDLADVDHFEGHPNMYGRTKIDTIVTHGDKAGEKMSCWAYFYVSYSEEDARGPFYDSYDSRADHGMNYDIRENEEHPDFNPR